ncbi:MAG: M43 family zinc metalloprotease [Spirosomataceae bacterium]
MVILKTSQPAGIFWSNESESLVLSADIKDEKGNLLTNYNGTITFYANGVEMPSNKFIFEKEGDVVFKAVVKGVESTTSARFLVKNPATALDKLVLSNAFYSKYAVTHTLVGSNPNLTLKGFDKDNVEVPIKKGLKATLGNESINLENFVFQKGGTHKIMLSAYGKQVETTFEVRQNRTFEVVRIPIMFHFCQPGPYVHPATKTTDAQFIEQAIEQLKNGKKLEQLNAMFRNQFVNNVQAIDPNAADTFIEFYLADKDPQGNALKENGINRLNFTRPFVALTETYVYNEAQRQYEVMLANELSKWNPNVYFNVVVENFGNWNYAGIAKMPMMDNNRKGLVPQEFFSLPFINTTIDKLAWGNTNTRIYADHVRLAGAINLLPQSPGVDGTLFQNSVLAHEIGHAFGLQHTFGLQENCQDQVHSDGLYDTPRQISANYETSCDGIKFVQRNLMNYISVPTRGYFTYDQVTVMRSRIEAGFNIPTPRNKGKSNGRQATEESVHAFGVAFSVSCGHYH